MTKPFQSTDTLFLSPDDIAKLVARNGLAATLKGMTEAIGQDFLRWQEFDKTARVASHSKDGVIELMPIADSQTYTFKYVNGHPKNTANGMSSVMAFGALADVDTGFPMLISELTLTTALRTAATSVVAAQALARKNSRNMALIGNGAQSEFQALAFHYIMGINELRLFDTDPQATAKLVRNLRAQVGDAALKLIVCNSTAEAVRGADIVTTITADKTNATIITPEMLEPGMHINGVGGDCPGKTEIHADVLRASKVFVEFEPQTRIEGDLQQMEADFAVTELWLVLTGQLKGRDNAEQITMFDSVGFAMEDFSALRYVYDTARKLTLGDAMHLIPALDNPKDLFSALHLTPAKQVASSQGATQPVAA
ncbi:MAG: ornithine cyclodeaminase [Burkholderiaceae bacterium]|jgi:ornithine cyclodeaminase